MTYKFPLPLIPPIKFNAVQPYVYRGAYPREVNFEFLETLQLKTILSLTPDPVTIESDAKLYNFAKRNNITLVHLKCDKLGKGKKRGVPVGYSTVLDALHYMIHSSYGPVYIHCLNGSQTTSLVVACLRKLQFWSSIAIFNEFINFATNITLNDRAFVEGFEGNIEVKNQDKVDWLWAGMSKGVVGNHPSIHVTQLDALSHT
jgi:tyrosine-protein phosphatase OCA6